ncbi:hypothetical protein DPMN_007577 [Dreissena polymorpha]|uniref:Uncharacterized protein n=1 Tax=Dreissena polymorpha TaxID=45954 RepID=A0A9D4MYQ9_DREPO|nr:hypothetical protein DPMN_007577 [Dreissena polymorpha]
MRINSASFRGLRLASACLGGQMRSFAAKCDLPPHTDAASMADSASTRCALLPRIAKYRCPVQFLARALEILEMLRFPPN